jgi:hypothetical protein
MGQKYKRKRLWIDPPFQGRLLSRLCLYAFLYFFILYHAGFFLELAFPPQGVELPRSSFGSLYAAYAGRHVATLVCFALTLPAILYDMLELSHRVAGPLFRCRRFIEDMAAGKTVTEFQPRKNDLMRDFFNSFNKLIKVWNARGASEPSATIPASAALEALRSQLPERHTAWAEQLAQDPGSAEQVEGQVRQSFQQLADQVVAELRAGAARQPSPAEQPQDQPV